MARKKKPVHHCADCGKEIGSTSTRCKSCIAKKQWESPEFRRQVSDKAKKQWESEEYRRGRSERTSEQNKKRWKSKKYQREQSEKAKKQWKPGGSLDHQRGSKSPGWQGGKSFEPYGPEFNEELKKSVRERDGNTCTICGKPGDRVHHIDYDKKNSSPDNLITLCISCHGKTGSRRKYWERKLKRMKK